MLARTAGSKHNDGDDVNLSELIGRIRSEIGDKAKPFRSLMQGDGSTLMTDLVQPNVNALGFGIDVTDTVHVKTLSPQTDYTIDEENGIILFTAPVAAGSTAIISGTSCGMFTDNELLKPIRDAVIWHCHNRQISERYRERHGFITYRETPIGLRNLPPEEELPLIVLATVNTYWMLADDMALDVNVQTAESTSINRGERYTQVMSQIDRLQDRYDDLTSQLNIGPKRIQTMNLRRTSQTTGRLIPLFKPREFDDHRYPVRMLPPIDHAYDDNSGVPSALFYGAGL